MLTAEAPYSVPRVTILKSLNVLISSRQAEAEDHFWALRGDPGYFTEVVGNAMEHSTKMILVKGARKHEALTSRVGRIQHLDDVIGLTVCEAYKEVHVWSHMELLLEQLMKADEIYSRNTSLPCHH